jgi:hypothetical protein
MEHFKYFIDKSIGLDNRLCLYKSSPTTRWNHLNTIYIRHRAIYPSCIHARPVFLHKEATFYNYHYFFSHISAQLASSISDIDVWHWRYSSNTNRGRQPWREGTHKSNRRSISEFKTVIMYQTLKRQSYWLPEKQDRHQHVRGKIGTPR